MKGKSVIVLAAAAAAAAAAATVVVIVAAAAATVVVIASAAVVVPFLRDHPTTPLLPPSLLSCTILSSGVILHRSDLPQPHTSDLKIAAPVATLPSAWRYRVNAGTGRSGVSRP